MIAVFLTEVRPVIPLPLACPFLDTAPSEHFPASIPNVAPSLIRRLALRVDVRASSALRRVYVVLVTADEAIGLTVPGSGDEAWARAGVTACRACDPDDLVVTNAHTSSECRYEATQPPTGI